MSSRIRTVDDDYLDLCRRVLETGKTREDRTKIGTISRFGERLDIDLKQGFPLLTTKRVFWKGVVRELIWFISGSVNSKELSSQGVHIWNGNSSREYLDSRGLTGYPEGFLGPVYGWQWRNFGAKMQGYCFDSDSRERGGIDQLADVIGQIRANPTDRRLIVSAWNPPDLPKMALPPCHLLYQFYVDENELSCQMYQRSCDVGLGLPFNIASYALLTHLVAHVCGLKVGRLIMCFGDTHIYSTHIEAIRTQLTRVPRDLPQLTISRPTDNIDSIVEADIVLRDYDPLPGIMMPMAV